VRNDLFWRFSDTALWWEQPETRDARAAALLHELASTVRDVEDATLIAYTELLEDQEDEDEFYELLNSVGSWWFPKTADAFVRRFISERSGAWVENIGP
jgi:hypothetical protein